MVMKAAAIRISIFVICFLASSCDKAFGLPSDTNAGHSELAKMSSEIKYKLPESRDNGLRGAIDQIFRDPSDPEKNLSNFQDFLSSADVAEDDLIGDGLIGARHFYDPRTEDGYLGIFQNAKDRANELYKGALADYCMATVEKAPGYLKKSWEKLSHAFHLLQDMTTPSHTNQSSHIWGDDYESYVKDNWDQWDASTPDAGKIIKDPNGPIYYTGIKDFLADYMTKNPYDSSKYQLYGAESYMNFLGGVSWQYESGKIPWEERGKNATDLLPMALMYGAGLINTFWDDINNIDNQGIPEICKRPPQPTNPAGDHPDDRFDVSSEFYYEKNLNLSLSDLITLNLRTAIKKGKIGVYYFRQAADAYIRGVKAETEQEKEGASRKIEELKIKIGTSSGQYRNDFATAPDVALFANGFYDPSISLMLKIGEPVSFQDIDFNPEIVKDHPILFVPTGGFYGLKTSEAVKTRIEEYVKNGGTLVLFAQQHGYDWNLLPTSLNPDTGERKPVTGYGYQEDQSCQWNSVYIDTYHPILSNFSTSTANIGVDGYFTSYPENSTILLRRTANNQPAMIIYPYGQGYVIATTLYTDFAFSHAQANQAEINLVHNIISWAKKPAEIPEIKPGETVSTAVTVKNQMDSDAASVKFSILDPSRKVISEQTISQTIGAGQSVIIPFPYTCTASSALGIYHLDYSLLDAQGNVIQPQAETDSGRFAVSNPPGRWTSDKLIWFSISSSSQEVLFGAPFDYTFHVYNNTDQIRNLTIRSYFGHTGRNHEWQIIANPQGETIVSGIDLFTDSWLFFDTLSASLYDEADEEIGTYQLSFRGSLPSAIASVQTDKSLYNKNENVIINYSLKNSKALGVQCNIKTSIIGPSNNEVFEEIKTVDLSPNGVISGTTGFTLPISSIIGSYAVRIEAGYGNWIISSASTQFELLQSQILIVPAIPAVLSSGSNNVNFTLTNTGKVDVSSGILDVSLKDPDGIVVYSGSQPFSIGVGQNTAFNIPFNLSLPKIGTYIFSYTQSDETREGMSNTLSFHNNATMALAFDKPSYRVRETAVLRVDLTNTGMFNLENALVSVAVPDAGFADSKNVSIPPNQNMQLAFSIPIAESITTGQHNVEVTFALSSGASIAKSMVFAVPESTLLVGYSGPTSMQAGDAIHLTIENKGGVDTTYTTEQLSLLDAKGIVIYQGNITGTSLAGEKKSFIDIQIPQQIGSGTISLSVQGKDAKNGKMFIF